MVNYGTTVTKAVVTVVPVLLSQSFHSYGTSVTIVQSVADTIVQSVAVIIVVVVIGGSGN